MASDKRDERDRRRRAIARRRIGLGMLIAAAVVAVIWGLVELWTAPLLPVTKIQIEGASRLSTESVLASAAIPAGTTLPKLPTAEIVLRLTENPWIARASLSRSLPGTVKISIVERKPAAVVDAGPAGPWLVSEDGYWIAPRSAQDTEALITIRDVPVAVPGAGTQAKSEELKNALAVVSGLSPELRARVGSISAATVDKTALLLKDDIQVFLGSAEDLSTKDELVRKILAKEKKLVYINVRVISRPTWRGLDAGN